MTEQNEVHLRVIRQALERGNAAVMVGAGFSLNAENGSILKGWAALAQGLYGELHPGEKAPPLGTSDMLRLAEEYHRAFSRSKLDNFLREQLPDEKVNPGSLHRSLLQLNWSEIFTTNYDTLLERAADENVETPHYVVVCREDIPESRIAKRRRIVKLHGSFPSQRPFIFTEEDYRLYPTNSAPFVNLVRQSMLENIFCLIGFSGDDPNFLQWIGWVRDMLEAHTLPIYIFLDKQPSFGQERLLQSRHITPVVLPQLDALGRVATFAERYAELFRLLQPIGLNKARLWPEESRVLDQDSSQSVEQRFNYIKLMVPIWRKSRLTYPGWVVAPYITRDRLYREEMFQQIHVLGGASVHKKLLEEPVIGVVVCAEYCWRQKVMLHPVWDDIAELSMKILSATEKYLHVNQRWSLTEIPADWGLTQSDLDNAWFALAGYVLRWLRQQMQTEKFNSWFAKLEGYASGDPHLLDSVIREKIQLNLQRGHIDDALELLEKWIPDPIEPYNNVLRAAWLAECGEINQAVSVAHGALRNIRKLSRLEPDSNFVLSREAWASQITYILERSLANFDEKEIGAEVDLKQRLSALEIRGHDPEREIDKLADRVNAEVDSRTSARVRTVGFDLGSSSSRHYFGESDRWDKVRACFGWCELTELVGYPSKVGNAAWRLDTFKQAAWWIKDNESQERVHGLMVRLADQKLFDEIEDDSASYLRWLTRDDVARLREEFAQEACNDAFNLCLAYLDGLNKNSKKRNVQIAFHLERFSRLVIRETREERLKLYANEILRMYADSEVQRLGTLRQSYANAFRRTFEALPDALLTQFYPNLIRLPINVAILVRQQQGWNDWPDWPSAVWNRKPPKKSVDVMEAVHTCVSSALVYLEAESTSEAEICNNTIINRLNWLNKNNLIDKISRVEILDVFGFDKVSFASYCNITPYELIRFRHLNIDKARYKKWVVENAKAGGVGKDLCRYWLHGKHYGIKWTLVEIGFLFSELREWWGGEVERIPSREKSRRVFGEDETRVSIEWLDAVLSELIIPIKSQLENSITDIDQWLSEFFFTVAVNGYTCWRSRLAICRQAGNVDLHFVDELLEALFGENAHNKERAVQVLGNWVLAESSLPIPDVLLDGIVSMVTSMTLPEVIYALDFISMVVEKRSSLLNGSILQRLGIAIDMLWKKSAYSRSKSLGIRPYDVPSVRYSCGKLVLALAKGGVSPVNPIDWAAQMASDPLPEIRQLSEEMAHGFVH